jgi:uncharacterized membrane protein
MKYCSHCGKPLDQNAKFCGKCGQKVVFDKIPSQETETATVSSPDSQGTNFFNLSQKQNIFSAIIWYIIILITLLPIHLFNTEDQDVIAYLLNTLMVVIFIFGAIALRDWKLNIKSILIIAISGLLSYLIGGIVGLLPIIFVFITDNPKSPEKQLDIYQIEYIRQRITKGFIIYVIGAGITLGSFFFAEEGGTFTLFYGAVLWGLFVIASGIFYFLFPKAIPEIENNQLSDQTSQEKEDESIFKKPIKLKSNNTFVNLIIYIGLVLFGIVTVVWLFS